jgi:cyclopropane fatty-acyl-phospholipid synthase-like methyltransferase
MKNMLNAGLLLVAVTALTGCAEVHRSDARFAATGYSANVLFLQIPGDPIKLAEAKIPEGSTVTNVSSEPNDWRTLPGFFNRLLGMGRAQIGGTTR